MTVARGPTSESLRRRVEQHEWAAKVRHGTGRVVALAERAPFVAEALSIPAPDARVRAEPGLNAATDHSSGATTQRVAS